MTSSGIVPYPALLGLTNEEGRRTVSDHAPIYLTIGSAKPGFISAAATDVDVASRPTAGNDCIDLNMASTKQLVELPNIGPARAQDIINGRPWPRVDDLARISGISSARAEEIQDSGQVCEL